MNRLLLYVMTSLVTFAFGVGIHPLLWLAPMRGAPTANIEPARVIIEPQSEIASALPPVATPSAIPAPFLILDYRDKFFPHAGFFMIGHKPKAFADFQFIELDLLKNRSYGNSYIEVYESSDKFLSTYVATFGLVTERKLFFVTSTASDSGYEYRFDGEFLSTDFESIAGKNKAALRGTLTKTKDGRTIAEHTVFFRMQHMGC
jgi:hypothetical protein